MENDIPHIEIVDADDVKEKSDQKAMPFKKYFDVVERIGLAKWIKENIEHRADRTIIAKVSDIAKEMGPEFENYGYSTIYHALRYVLFQYGIMTSLKLHSDGSNVLVMKEKRPRDKLPQSYKHLEERVVKKEDNEEGDVRLPKPKLQQVISNDIYAEEKRSMRQEIEELKNELKEARERLDRKEKKTYMVEVFRINWKTLEWKMIKGKVVKTENGLFNTIKEYASTPEVRYRIEITPVESIVANNNEVKVSDNEAGDEKNGEHV